MSGVECIASCTDYSAPSTACYTAAHCFTLPRVFACSIHLHTLLHSSLPLLCFSPIHRQSAAEPACLRWTGASAGAGGEEDGGGRTRHWTMMTLVKGAAIWCTRHTLVSLLYLSLLHTFPHSPHLAHSRNRLPVGTARFINRGQE